MDEETSECVNAVFGNDMLRELILDFAIHQRNNIICRKTLCNIRHVQKCWKLSVSDCMRKNKEPLYKLVLNGNNSIIGTPYVQERGKILEQFLKFIVSRNETFCLFIKPEFFRLENHKTFTEILSQADTKLVELDMLVPTNAGSLPCMISNVKLPKLQKLSVKLTEQTLGSLESESATFQQPMNIVLLLQSILNRNKSLKVLKIEHKNSTLPGLQYIYLPNTINILYLDCLLSNQEMHLLVQNKLPCLSSLSFKIPNRELPDNLVFRILNNFRTTLKNVSIEAQLPFQQSPIFRNSTSFPIMEKLEHLKINSLHVEQEPTSLCRLDKCFPRLKSLRCLYQTEEKFMHWFENSSKLESVIALALHIANISELYELKRFSSLPSVEILQGVKQLIPNICLLELYIEANDALGLTALLSELVHLETLALILTNAKFVVNSDLWDSFLTGIPVDEVTSLRAAMMTSANYLDNLYVKMDDKPSIRMLKKLSGLKLDTVPSTDGRDSIKEPLISPLSFKFAFIRMLPTLTVLNLFGRFKVSDDVFEKWWKLRRYAY